MGFGNNDLDVLPGEFFRSPTKETLHGLAGSQDSAIESDDDHAIEGVVHDRVEAHDWLFHVNGPGEAALGVSLQELGAAEKLDASSFKGVPRGRALEAVQRSIARGHAADPREGLFLGLSFAGGKSRASLYVVLFDNYMEDRVSNELVSLGAKEFECGLVEPLDATLFIDDRDQIIGLAEHLLGEGILAGHGPGMIAPARARGHQKSSEPRVQGPMRALLDVHGLGQGLSSPAHAKRESPPRANAQQDR